MPDVHVRREEGLEVADALRAAATGSARRRAGVTPVEWALALCYLDGYADAIEKENRRLSAALQNAQERARG